MIARRDRQIDELLGLNRRITRWRRLACQERDQWKACAEKLAAALVEADAHSLTRHPAARGNKLALEAFEEFQRLKGDSAL